jgi:hypothetical protein
LLENSLPVRVNIIQPVNGQDRFTAERDVDLVQRTTILVDCGTGEPDAITNAIGYAKFFSRSHDAVIRVCDQAGNVIETREHKGDFKER